MSDCAPFALYVIGAAMLLHWRWPRRELVITSAVAAFVGSFLYGTQCVVIEGISQLRAHSPAGFNVGFFIAGVCLISVPAFPLALVVGLGFRSARRRAKGKIHEKPPRASWDDPA